MISVVVLLSEFVILALLNGTGTTDAGNFIAGMLILVHAFVTIASFGKNKKLKKYSHYLMLAYLLRLLFLGIDLFAYPRIHLPDGHSDEDMFYVNAFNYVSTGTTGRGFYPQVMGTLFRMIGTNRLFGQYVSMLPSIVALVFLAYSLFELEIDGSVGKRVFGIACLMPYNAILSSLFVREASMYMFLSMSYYQLVLWTRNKRELHYYSAAGLVLPAALFHNGTIAVLVGYVLIRMMYDNKKEKISISFRNIAFSLMFAFLAVFVLSRTGGSFTARFNNVESLEDIANTFDMGGSSYARYVGNSNNPVNFLIYSPLRVLFFTLSPVPWLWRGMTDIIAFCFGTMFYVVALWKMIKFLRTHEEKNRALVIAFFIIAASIIFVFAWGTTNAGTASRHREKMQVLFALIWALSSDSLRLNKSRSIKPRRKIAV